MLTSGMMLPYGCAAAIANAGYRLSGPTAAWVTVKG